MEKENEFKKNQYNYHGNISSEGTLDLTLYFPNKKPSKEEAEMALAESLFQVHDFMLKKGYLLPNARFMSPSDVAKEYGHTRQYWEKLIKEGKIFYKETAAGSITTDLWVNGYLNNKERVDEYVRFKNKVVASIAANDKKWGKTKCPQCGKMEFDFAVNVNNINGVCRAGCGFRINATI